MAYLIFLAIIIFPALWVHKDATRFRKKGVDLNPGLWSTLVFLFLFIAFPWYLILRFLKYKKTAQLGNPPLPPKSRIYNWLLVIIFIGIPFLIGLFLLATSLLRAQKQAAQPQKLEAVEQIDHAGLRAGSYDGVILSFLGKDNLDNKENPGMAEIYLPEDQKTRNYSLLYFISSDTRVYKNTNDDKNEISVFDLDLKKGDTVFFKYYIGGPKANVIKEIILK